MKSVCLLKDGLTVQEKKNSVNDPDADLIDERKYVNADSICNLFQ